MNCTTSVHFGIGVELSLGYRITDNLSASIYSGVTYLTGARMDGMPEYLHRNNYVWDSGVKLTWRFGKKRAKRSQLYTAPAAVIAPATPIVEEAIQAEVVVVVEAIKPAEVAEAEEQVAPTATDANVEGVELTEQDINLITTIYFDQYQTYLPASEYEKLDALLELMNANPELIIVITGWADSIGSIEANLQVTNRRAQNVGWWLTRLGIPYSRLKMSGKAIYFATDDMDKARRVDVIKLK